MNILLVNPNTTASMTAKAADAARDVVGSDTQIIATNPVRGPASIQGYYDAALCVPELLTTIAQHPQADAIVIACFDDTGLDAVRCTTEVPVIGIGEAAFHAASMLSCKFSVITTLSRSVPGIEANLTRYGLMSRCARVRATDVPVLALEQNDPATLKRIEDEVQRAIDEDQADAIVLGCAGMTDLMSRLHRQFRLPVVDGVVCAAVFAEALVRTGLQTSKIGGYADPSTAEAPQAPVIV